MYQAIGGLFEPVWVMFLAKSREQQGSKKAISLTLFAAVSVVSVFFVGLAMRSANIGVQYQIWTAIGALATLLLSIILMKEKFGERKIIGVIMILIGIIGIELCGGA